MNIETIIFGLGLCFFAGLATSLGSGIIYFINFKDRDLSKILSISLGISAGVMISISVFELIPYTLEKTDFISTVFAFFIGFIGIMIIDVLVPHSYKEENTTSTKLTQVFEKTDPSKQMDEVKRVGYFTAFGLAIHNLPEGLASFSGFIISPILGITTAIAIAIHNIPEGISVSVPLASAGKSKKSSFLIGSFSGLMEPFGAIITLLILFPFIDQLGPSLALILSFVAGIMVFISLDELLPLAFKYNLHNLTNSSVLVGMIIMVVTLVILD